MKKLLFILLSCLLLVSTPAFSAVGWLYTGSKFQAFDVNGDVLSGGKLYTYTCGTTTPKATYPTDADATAETNANANPVVLDSRGEANVFAVGCTKFILKDSSDVTIWTVDNIEDMNKLETNTIFLVDHNADGTYKYKPGNYYYPDATATDQGVTGNSNTLKYYVDTLGSDNGTIYLRHTSGNATTTYTFSTNETIPSNIKFKIESGAVISITSGVTLTIEGPFEAGLYQVFSGDGTVSFGSGSVTEVYPEWWGAVGDGVTDDSSSIQSSVASLQSIGGRIQFSGNTYKVLTEISIVNGGSVGYSLMGVGGHASHITTDSALLAGDAIFNINSTGPSTIISDLVLTGNSVYSTNYCIKATGNGLIFSNLWLGGSSVGLYLTSATARVINCLAEINGKGFVIDSSKECSFVGCKTYQNIFSGFYFKGAVSLSGSESPSVNNIDNCILSEDGTGGDGSQAAIYITSNVPLAISNCVISSFNNAWPQIGIKTSGTPGDVTISNTIISHCKIAGIEHNTDSTVSIIGGIINDIGNYDQTTPWATYGIFKDGNTGRLIVQGTIIRNVAGYGIRTVSPYNIIDNVLFDKNLYGGYGGSINATTGDKDLYLEPKANYFHAQISNCFFRQSGTSTGKTAIYIGGTVTPLAHNIKIFGCNMLPASYATPFDSVLTNSDLLTYDIINNDILIKTSNSGTATISSGSTSTTVTHGLGLTPNAEHISIIGKENPTNSIGTSWIDTITSTQFTVNVENDPGASGWDFGWKVTIQ